MAQAVVTTGLAAASAIANVAATKARINEAIGDYNSEINRLRDMRNARLTEMSASATRAREIGIAGLEERAAAGKFDTQTAMMKAEMTSSAERAKIGASGVKATGSALMGSQQATDIAYAAADRVAEASASGIRVGGMELGQTLQTAAGERSLLTLEYRQGIAEQKRKRAELEKNQAGMLWAVALGGAAGVAQTFYSNYTPKPKAG